MKTLLLFLTLFICFKPNIYPQELQPAHNNTVSLSSIVYKPVKITLDDTLRYTYTYDNKANPLTYIFQTKRNGSWENNWKFSYIYDLKGNKLTTLLADWYNSTWRDSVKYTYSYDVSGNCLTELIEYLSNGILVSSTKKSYTYDYKNRKTSELDERWSDNIWTNSWKQTITYDSLRITNYSQEWYNGQWDNPSRSTSILDSLGNCIVILTEDLKGDQWEGFMRTTYSYNNKNNILTELFESWWLGAWTISSRNSYTYDSLGNMIVKLNESRRDTSWKNLWRQSYTYDSKGNPLTYLYENYTYKWNNANKATYAYDVNGNATHAEAFEYSLDKWSPHAINLWLWYNGHTERTGACASVIDIEYTSITTGVDKKTNALISFNLAQNYPNPFNPATTISYSIPKESFVVLKVYDMLGREVSTLVNEKKNAGEYRVQFDGTMLPSGIYVYTMKAGEFMESKKLLLLK